MIYISRKCSEFCDKFKLSICSIFSPCYKWITCSFRKNNVRNSFDYDTFNNDEDIMDLL
jgi:hypothetical protein